MRAYARCLTVAVALCAGLLVTGFAEPAASSDHPSASVWLGWRGLTQEGRSPVSLPTSWDARGGLKWKVAIPGRGHSSAIVDADQVYVSTAYPEKIGVYATALDGLAAGLATLLVMLATREVVRLSEARLSPTAFLIRAVATIAIALVLFVVAWVGEGLLDFPRCDIRGWLASASFVTLCYGLAMLHTRSRVARLLGCAAAIAFAVVVGAAVPSRDHAFRGGVLALNSQMVFTTLAMPFGAGLVGVWRTIPRRARWWLPVVLLVGAAMCAAALLRHLLVFRNDSLLEVTYQPKLGVWPIVAAVAAVWWAFASFRAKTRATTMGVATAVAVLGLIGMVSVGEQIAARSNYLAYHIGTPRLAPLGGMPILAAACAAIVLHALVIVGWPAGRGGQPGWPEKFSPSLRTCALVLAVVFFVRVNYVHAESRMVRAVVAVDRLTGAVRWVSPGLAGPNEVVDGRNSPATPTPVADGERVCAYFGNPGVMCLDRDGRPLWSRADVGYAGFYGVGFSPVLAEGVLVLASDMPQGTAIVHAFDVRTGTVLWRRDFRTMPATSGNNRTPIVKTIRGETIVILWGRDYLKGLRLHTGEVTWQYAPSPGGDLVSSLVSDDERLYLSDVTGTVALSTAALAEGLDPVQWKNAARANCVSPVLCGGLLVTVTDAGVITSVRTDTGQTVWRQRLPGFYFSSLLASPAAVYATNSDGVTTVFACDAEFRLVARNDIEEPVAASLAAAGGTLFLRGARNLYAIGER